MRLRSKLMVITAVASIGPIVVGALVGRQSVQHRSKVSFARLLTDGEHEVRAQFKALQEEVTAVVERLADAEDDFTGQILIALAKGGMDDVGFRRLARGAPRAMRQRGLDLLAVVGPQGRVLASGHFPGKMGDKAYGTVKSKRSAQLLPERVIEGERPRTRLTIQVWREAKSALGTEVNVMGGVFLDRRFLRRLRLRGDTEVMLEDRQGKELAGPRDWRRYRRYPRRVVPLKGPDGRSAAQVVLAVPDDQLRSTLAMINYAAGALVGGGVLLSLLLGGIARRTTRPLEELAKGAVAVASGDLDRRIPVRSQDEVGDLVATFNRMTSQLKDSRKQLVAAERVAAWQEIARRIAHEIKNPLFPIQTSIETLRKVHRKKHHDFEEIFDESTSTILHEVARMKRIVGEFSDFARMPKPILAPCDVGEIVASVLSLYSGAKTPIGTDVADDLPPVLADREQLIQVLVNLVKNAEEALADQPTPEIVVAAKASDEFVQISVQDNGDGFDEETAATLFTPYFTTKGGSGGTGLGLAVVHRIVTDHKGTIEANGASGKGATFTVCLPLHQPAS